MSTLNHLTTIRDKHGKLNPELVVKEATNPTHPLHDRFDWDDTEAARKWRLEQAGQLLRVVMLPNTKAQPRSLRAFVAVKEKDSHHADYMPTEEAFSNDFTRQLVLNNMEREWRTLRKRYEHMSEFAEMITTDLHGETDKRGEVA